MTTGLLCFDRLSVVVVVVVDEGRLGIVQENASSEQNSHSYQANVVDGDDDSDCCCYSVVGMNCSVG